FRNETELVARLQHPNIVQIHEVGEHEGQSYFSMEFANGGTLAQKLAAGPLPYRVSAELVAILARTIQFAHERGIVHRDLKPSNILLSKLPQSVPGAEERRLRTDPAGEGCLLTTLYAPRISDFGLAKCLEPAGEEAVDYQTETGAILGTPAYMAPEQAAGH